MSGRRLKHRARLGGAVPIVPPGEDYRTPSAAVEEVTELFLTRYGARTPDRLGQSSFVAKTRVRDPGIRLVQTVFKTPFLGAHFDFGAPLNWRLDGLLENIALSATR